MTKSPWFSRGLYVAVAAAGGVCLVQPPLAHASSSIVKELRQARLERIKNQAMGGSSYSDIEPAAAGPAAENENPVTVSTETVLPIAQSSQPPLASPIPAAAPPPPAIPSITAEDPPSEGSATVAQAGTGTAGTTFRRQPIEAPILPEDRWLELLYAVELNGQEVSPGEIVQRSPDGETIAVPVNAAQGWRLKIEPDLILELGGIPYYPISRIPGARVESDEARLILQITLPPSAFEAVERTFADRVPLPPPKSSTGGFLDYDIVATGGDTIDERIDGLLELGAFSPLGMGLTSVQLSDAGGDDFKLVRLETTLFRDFPDDRASLRLGDGLITGGSFTAGTRFAGLQWASNFATDPNFVTFPLPVIGGLNEQQSVIEVVSDNLNGLSADVPAGPFRIGEIPVVTGAGELQVTVTDLLGRERTVTQPYYVSPNLLKPDLHEFAYEIGFEREDFGEDSFNYGNFLASTTHRYGLTSGLTLEGHAEADLDGATLIGGGAAMLGGLGVIAGGVGISGEQDADAGYLGQLSYDYRRREFNIGLRTRYTSEDYRSLGSADGSVEREDQFNFGVELGDTGRLGVLLLNREFHDADPSRSVTGSFSTPLFGGSLLFNAAHTFEPDTDTAFIASFSMPLSQTRSIAAIAEKRDSGWLGRTQYRRNRGSSDLGLDYRIGGEVSDDGGRVDGRLGYNFASAATSLELEHDDDGSDLRAGVSGSLALIEGEFAISRPLGRAFGLVDLQGYPDVSVYLDNQEIGQTNAEGKLLLPSLRPYQANKVSINIEDLPIETQVVDEEVIAVPFEGAGVRVPLALGGGRSATAWLTSQTGEPLPAGIELLSASGATRAQVAREGLAQLDGIQTVPTEISGEIGGQRFTCSIQGLPLDGEPFPDLGTIRCE